jgi:transposase-like protein
MSGNDNGPKTLQDAIVYFADPDHCLDYLVARRWPNGVECPTCGRKDVSFIASRRVWQCKTRHPEAQFSVKVGTVFEDSPLGLNKWLPVVWMVANCKNGVSSYEIHRAIGVTQKTAWFMLHRIRLAMQESGGKLQGQVEVDETFIGGKARNMHASKRNMKVTGSGPTDKAIALGMVERGGRVHVSAPSSRSREELEGTVREHVAAGAAIFTDEYTGYRHLHLGAEGYEHKVVNHAIEYVNGNVHTNTIENFWSLLKRSLHGTYVSVEPFHLFRYLDEQAFRYNYRKDMNDGERFSRTLSQIAGKRLTYTELTGKVGETKPEPIN